MIDFKNKKSSPAAKQKAFRLQANICYCKTVVEANLWSDEQKSHQAVVKDKVATQTKVQ